MRIRDLLMIGERKRNRAGLDPISKYDGSSLNHRRNGDPSPHNVGTDVLKSGLTFVDDVDVSRRNFFDSVLSCKQIQIRLAGWLASTTRFPPLIFSSHFRRNPLISATDRLYIPLVFHVRENMRTVSLLAPVSISLFNLLPSRERRPRPWNTERRRCPL